MSVVFLCCNARKSQLGCVYWSGLVLYGVVGGLGYLLEQRLMGKHSFPRLGVLCGHGSAIYGLCFPRFCLSVYSLKLFLVFLRLACISLGL